MSDVLVDNTGQEAHGLSTTTITIGSFAVGAGANRCIHLAVSQYKASDTAPTATFNGTENFVVHDQATISEAPGTRRVTILKLVNPSNVTANIVVSWASAVDEAVCGATSWSNVNQTTPFGTAVKNTNGGATSSTVSVPNASGDVVHDAISTDALSAADGTANQTQRWHAIAAANTSQGAGQSALGAGSNVSCSWTGFGGTYVLAHIGVAIQQATGGAAAPIGFVPGTKAPPGMPGPRDRLGFLRQQVWDYTIPASAVFADTVAETGSAADSETATADFAAARAEGLAGADTETATADFAGARAEALTAADSSTGALTAVVATTETLVAADTETGTLTTAGSVTETLSAADSETGALAAQGLLTETLSATDTQDASVTGAGDAVTESATATATQSATVAFAGATAEVLTAADAATATFVTSVAVAEVVSANESELGSVATLALIAEILALADAQDATVPGAFALVRGPLYIDFDDLATSSEFDDLTTSIAFDDYTTTIRFFSLDGEEIMGPLKLYEGEVVDVQFVLKGAGDVAQDLTNASTIKWTVGEPDEAPVVNQASLVPVAPATNGRVKYVANAALTAVGGRYKSLAVVTFPGGIVRKFPGDVLIESAII